MLASLPPALQAAERCPPRCACTRRRCSRGSVARSRGWSGASAIWPTYRLPPEEVVGHRGPSKMVEDRNRRSTISPTGRRNASPDAKMRHHRTGCRISRYGPKRLNSRVFAFRQDTRMHRDRTGAVGPAIRMSCAHAIASAALVRNRGCWARPRLGGGSGPVRRRGPGTGGCPPRPRRRAAGRRRCCWREGRPARGTTAPGSRCRSGSWARARRIVQAAGRDADPRAGQVAERQGRPALAQKPRSAMAELCQVAGAPLVHANCSCGTLATAMNRLPIAFWHIRQWQMSAAAGSA